MSSIRTGTSPAIRVPWAPRVAGGPAGSPEPAPHRCAAARSASVNAAQIQITSACAATAATPGVIPLIRPPPPRLPISVPSAPNQ